MCLIVSGAPEVVGRGEGRLRVINPEISWGKAFMDWECPPRPEYLPHLQPGPVTLFAPTPVQAFAAPALLLFTSIGEGSGGPRSFLTEGAPTLAGDPASEATSWGCPGAVTFPRGLRDTVVSPVKWDSFVP